MPFDNWTISDSWDLGETLYGIFGFDGPLYRCTGKSGNTSWDISSFQFVLCMLSRHSALYVAVSEGL